jgi:hypothetical protein
LVHTSPSFERLLPSENTVRAWIVDAFEKRRKTVKHSLQEARSRIHLACDGWSSPSGKHFLGIVGHWLDKDRQLRCALLALPRVYGGGGEEDLAPALTKTINFYDIGNKLGAFQMDNATNNDTCLDALAVLYPIDVEEQRLRCLGHVVNLVVKALLFGEGLSQFQRQVAEANDSEQFKIWRRQGSIGKLHNLVTFINRSPQRMEAFSASQREAADGLTSFSYQLKRDTGVRWNSVYAMIERGIKLRPAIEHYCWQWREKLDLTADTLDSKDWADLEDFKQLLKPFEQITKRTEGHAVDGAFGAVWEVLPCFELLFNKLKLAAEKVERNKSLYSEQFESCLNLAFVKLQHYYNATDKSRIYRAAVALHPGKRFDWFERTWGKEEGGRRTIAQAKAAVKSIWKDYLNELPPPPPSPLKPQLVRQGRSYVDDEDEDEDWRNCFGDYVAADSANAAREHAAQKEIDTFLSTVPQLQQKHINKPLLWWKDVGEQLYPTLAGLAYNLFSIPGMSSECERAFSQAKRMVTDERHGLKEDIIEADQCLKSWLVNGLVDGSSLFQQPQQKGAERVEGAKAAGVRAEAVEGGDEVIVQPTAPP